MVTKPPVANPPKKANRWLVLTLVVSAFVLIGMLAWPYINFLTDREALREIILGSGIWAPLVYIALQFTQVVVAPIPSTVIGLAGGYVFETFWSTIYSLIGTTLGFWVVFTLSKRYGRRIMKYFASPESVAKYDHIATKKSAFAFIAIAFLFPFIPDPVLGYIAGTTPISTRVLMIMCFVMRIPGVLFTSLIGSQVGQGNYATVVVLVIAMAIVLLLSLIFYKHINAWADKLYNVAMRENKRAAQVRKKQETSSKRRKLQRRRKRKALAKRMSRRVTRRKRTKKRR